MHVKVFCGTLVFAIICSCTEMESSGPCITFVSSGTPDSVYLHKFNWGIQGNSRKIIISKKRNIDFNHRADVNTEYLFSGDFPFFVKRTGDTVKVYTYKKSAVPEGFKSKIDIVQVEIDNLQNMNLRDDPSYIDLYEPCSDLELISEE